MSGRRLNTQLATIEAQQDELAPAGPPPTVGLPRLLVVSDAMPLHTFGLVPPPATLGAHLWHASPIEVAVAAAVATADTMAIPPPPPPPPPAPPPPVDEPVAAVEGMPTWALDSNGAGPQAEPLSALVDARPEVQYPAMAAAAVADRVSKPAEALATLDLSRRAALNTAPADLPEPPSSMLGVSGDAVAAQPPPRPPSVPRSVLPPPDVALPPLRMLAVAPPSLVQGPLPQLRAEPDDRWQDLSAAWPGFATGLVVALAVGAGVYLTLSGG